MNTSGRHFLQIPGPTNVPDRILRALQQPTIDHRGPDFKGLCRELLDGLKEVFKTRNPVIIFPASGTGAWESALVNTLSPGDRVLMFETGHFGTLWKQLAEKLGLQVDWIPGNWREGVNPEKVEELLNADHEKQIRAVCVVHNETATGVTSDISSIRKAVDRTGHPALFMVDTISSLASMDYRHDEWKVDVTVAGSQKGLMLPPGLSFNLHPRDQPPLRIEGGADPAQGGRTGSGFCAPPPTGGSNTESGSGLEPGNERPPFPRIQRFPDRGEDAGRSRCRSIQKGRARKFQCLTGQRPWENSGEGFSYRTPRRLQCPDAPRNPRSD